MAVAVYKVAVHVVGVIAQFHFGVGEHVFVHVHRLVQFHLEVKGLDLELHASGLDAGEVQKLFDHTGQAAALLVDDFQSLHDFLGVGGTDCEQRLAPAVNRGQRRAQLVRYRRDKVIFHALGARDLIRHVVNGVAQLTDLVIVRLLQAHTVSPGGDFLCDDVYFGDRLQNGL